MDFLKGIYLKLFKNKISVFLYFVFINLPLLIFTFNTDNWYDDYMYGNLLAVKARFSPLLPLIFETVAGHAQGGHFAPVYTIINLLITSVSTDPKIFHFIIIICYIATAFFSFLIVDRYYRDKALGLLAGTLFAVNYYIGLKALAWNTWHFSATSTFTGVISVYFLIRYLQEKRICSLLICALFLILTILNYENGFIFFPILIIFAFFALLKKQIGYKKLIPVVLILSAAFALYPLGAWFETGKVNPLSYRLEKTYEGGRSLQGYAFRANDLFVRSTGLSILYNKLVFDRLKQNPQLKETVRQLVRENKTDVLKKAPFKFIAVLSAVGIFTILLFVAIAAVIFRRMRRQTCPFLISYGCVLLMYVFVLYRIDMANALSVFSGIVLADLIVSFLRDKKRGYQWAGAGILGLYLVLTVWTIFDKFDDCYRKSFYGLPKSTLQGQAKVHKEINEKIGRLAENGIILFMHDYSAYHQTTGFERIGDTIDIGDTACFNAAIYAQDLLKTDIVGEYRDKSFKDFYLRFSVSPDYKEVIVSSLDEAWGYLKTNNINVSEVEAIYVSKDYKVTKLGD